MTDMTPERLNAIRRRAEAATEGPWSAANEHGNFPEADPLWRVSQMRPGWESMSPTEGYITDVAETFSDDPHADPNAEFIAHARTDVPDLLTEVKRLRLISARLYDVATLALPHIYEGLCPDPQQPDERDPSCDACNALIDPTEGEANE